MKLTDFGLARSPSSPRMTQSGEFAGSPSYMSPEQARGEQGLADDEHRADEEADQVVDERRLASFVVVAEELEQPAGDEGADAAGEPARDAAAGAPLREEDQRAVQGAHRDAEQEVAAGDVPER